MWLDGSKASRVRFWCAVVGICRRCCCVAGGSVVVSCWCALRSLCTSIDSPAGTGQRLTLSSHWPTGWYPGRLPTSRSVVCQSRPERPGPRSPGTGHRATAADRCPTELQRRRPSQHQRTEPRAADAARCKQNTSDAHSTSALY